MHGDTHVDMDLQFFRVTFLGAVVGVDDFLVDSPGWLVHTSANRGLPPDL